MDWAALDYEKLANAIVILVVGLAAGLGLRAGRAGRSATGIGNDAIEVAGALVDSKSVKALEGAVKDLVRSMDEGIEENLNQRKSMERAVKDLADALKDVTHGLAAVKEEMIRGKRG